jgi:hypothetical protein
MIFSWAKILASRLGREKEGEEEEKNKKMEE